jgi:hypothetical protein
MRVGTLGILVDQLTGDQQVRGNDLCQFLGKTPQFGADGPIESADVGTDRDRGLSWSCLEPGRCPPLGIRALIIPPGPIVSAVALLITA